MSNKHNISALIKKLQLSASSIVPSLEKAVANQALNYETPESISCFFEDLLQHGCISGMVGSLIYYADTEAFFDNHYHEIMELKEEFEESIGEPMRLPYNLKNHLAWFGFEETARRLWEAE